MVLVDEDRMKCNNEAKSGFICKKRAEARETEANKPRNSWLNARDSAPNQRLRQDENR